MQQIRTWYKQIDGELDTWLSNIIKSGFEIEQVIVKDCKIFSSGGGDSKSKIDSAIVIIKI